MIKFQDISVVVQGGIFQDLTSQCLVSIRKYLPDSEIILSTWSDCNIENLEYDVLVLNEKPASFYYNSKKNKRNNVNFQIVSTFAGIKKSTRKYILKLRSDFCLTGTQFLDFFTLFPKADSDYQIYKQKIVNCSFFTRNPKVKGSQLLFHPSDIALFGLKEDVLDFFDAPMMTAEDEYYIENNSVMCNRYVPEQHLFINSLRKNGHIINVDHQADISNKNIELTERYIASNFIIILWKEFNIKAPSKFYDFVDNDFSNCITHVEWKCLYRKYIDQSYIISEEDIARKNLETIYRSIKKYKFIARWISCIFPTPLLATIRRKSRNRIFKFFIKRFVNKTSIFDKIF